MFHSKVDCISIVVTGTIGEDVGKNVTGFLDGERVIGADETGEDETGEDEIGADDTGEGEMGEEVTGDGEMGAEDTGDEVGAGV